MPARTAEEWVVYAASFDSRTLPAYQADPEDAKALAVFADAIRKEAFKESEAKLFALAKKASFKGVIEALEFAGETVGKME